MNSHDAWIDKQMREEEALDNAFDRRVATLTDENREALLNAVATGAKGDGLVEVVTDALVGEMTSVTMAPIYHAIYAGHSNTACALMKAMIEKVIASEAELRALNQANNLFH